MIKFTTGNIFTAEVEAVINTVNCVGVMGRGITLQFKKKFPENYKLYAKACKDNSIVPGKVFITETMSLTDPKYIVNFPTKRHWKGKSRIEDIESGLEDLVIQIKKYKIKSIAIPPLGAGLSGLNWKTVKDKITTALDNVENVDIIVFEPKTNNSDNINSLVNPNNKTPNMTIGRAALIKLIDQYQSAMLTPIITLLEVHKLMYFMQESGQPLKLEFKKHHYGPYAENLRHVLNRIEGYFISGYKDGGDNPTKELKLINNSTAIAFKTLEGDDSTLNHFKKVAKLVEGFESSFGLELLATTHWVIKNENAKSLEDVISKVHSWNPRKSMFKERHIEIAFNRLNQQSWV